MHRKSLMALVAAIAAVGACQQEQPQTDNEVAEEPVRNAPSVPRPRPPLDRAALLTAVAEAASATAAGAELPESVRSLDSRQFEFRIRFGCRGPVTDLAERWLGWSFDPERRRIRVRARPTISKSDPIVMRIGSEGFEAVEGFWIPRPWLFQPVCPVAAALQSTGEESQAPSPSASGRPQREQQAAAQAVGQATADDQERELVPRPPRVGIAQYFTGEDPRTRRRDMRPYEASHTLDEGKAISSQGYNLVLAGRLRAPPGLGVIQCAVRGPDNPPECIISAEFLRVWIEQPGTREVIAQWGGG